MPGRLEFETEYENEAEQVVKDMLFSEEDTPEEVGTLRLNAGFQSAGMNPCTIAPTSFSNDERHSFLTELRLLSCRS